MLGLGNALTRSINFGKIGAVSIFNNAPAIGEEYEGGIVAAVNEYSGPQNANAVIDVVYPYLIQFESNSNYFDTDYIDAAISYVKSYQTITNGVVYDDWIPADGNRVEYWLDNIYNENTYTANSNKSVDYIAAVSPIYLDWHESHEPVNGSLPIDDYSGPTANTLSVYATNNLNVRYNPQQIFYQNNTVSLVLKRRIFTTLEYNEQIVIDNNSSTSGTQTKNIGNDLFSLSVNNLNQDSLNKEAESFGSNYNSLFVSTKNGVITCSIKFSLGNNPADVSQKYQEIPLVWRQANDLYAEFDIDSIFHLDPYGTYTSSSGVPINYFLRYLNEQSVRKKVQIRKVTSADFNNDGSYIVNNDIVYYLSNGSISEIFLSRVFELDVSDLSALPLLFSLIELGYQTFNSPSSLNSVYHSTSNVTFDEMIASGATLDDVHFSRGSSTSLPRGLWWSRFRISNLKFTSPRYIESDLIQSPPTLQNIVVPMIPEIGGLNISIGDELEDGGIFFRVSDFFASSLNPIFTPVGDKTMNVVGSVKYAVDTVPDLSNIDTNLLEVGDNVFVGLGGNSYQTVYTWDGADFNAVPSITNNTYNFRGSLYKRGDSNYFLLDSTDIINYE